MNDFDEHREHSQAKRASNRERSTQVLVDRGVSFESKNHGAHLLVFHNGGVIDFWPGTGKFTNRTTKFTGRGVFHMLKMLGYR